MIFKINSNNSVVIICYILFNSKLYFVDEAKIDTGADITVISESNITRLLNITEICQKAHYFSGGMNGKVLLISA